ncbi:hypothetical protein EOL70_12980 [Leucothrix sargassi]|nr:hypothetical protein EOL70_12980 [Leucothrix sargassi]
MKRVSKAVLSVLATCSVSTTFASPWPVGTNDEATAVYRQATVIPVIPNDIGENLYIAEVNTTSLRLGSVRINEDKLSVTYTSANATEDEFWYVLKDDQGRTNAAKVTVSISDDNWPAANGDTAEATYNEVITIPVLDNDSGTDLKLSSVNAWSVNQGNAWIENGELKYQQVGDPRGDISDEFWYVFEDKWGRKNAAKVVVSVSEAAVETNPYPVATPDFAETTDLLKAFIPVLDNDSGTGLSLKETNAWTQNGGRTVIVDNVIKYTAPSDFEGTDAFWYVFEDNQGRTNSAKVEVQVTKGPQFSTVEYCGNVYQTDGTAENTTIIRRAPTVAPNDIEIRDMYAFLRGGGTIGDRTYGVNGRTETGFDLWVTVDGVSTKVTSSQAGSSMALVGVYGDFIYYTIDGSLYGHDGDSITTFNDLFAGLAETDEERTTYNIRTRKEGNTALYIFAEKSERDLSDRSSASYSNTWRISDGLGDKKFYVNIEPSADEELGADGEVNVARAHTAYFNGIDYFVFTIDDRNLINPNRYSIAQSVSGVPLNTVYGRYSSGSITVVNNSRLFALTDPYYISQSDSVDGKLYVVDKNDDFVEIASCDILDFGTF